MKFPERDQYKEHVSLTAKDSLGFKFPESGEGCRSICLVTRRQRRGAAGPGGGLQEKTADFNKALRSVEVVDDLIGSGGMKAGKGGNEVMLIPSI